MATAVFQASEYDALPPGVYDAVVVEISDESSAAYGAFRKWTFTVTTDEGEQPLTAATSAASGPKSKAYQWASVLIGHKPGDDAVDLVGRRCQLVLTVNAEGFNRVESMLPPAPAKGESTLNLGPLNKEVFDKPD